MAFSSSGPHRQVSVCGVEAKVTVRSPEEVYMYSENALDYMAFHLEAVEELQLGIPGSIADPSS